VKLYVESLLPVDPTTAWRLFESDEFDVRLAQQTNITAEKLEQTETPDGMVSRRMRYRSATELPSIVAKALGSKNLTYEQTNHMNRNTGTMVWSVQLPIDRVKVAGTTAITAHPQGCRRVVDGEISVAVPLIGGQIEKAVVGEFEKSMGRAVDIVRQLIAEQKLGR
jgi:hypothetical protein